MSTRSCKECQMSSVCYAYFVTKEKLENCGFINTEYQKENYPQDVVGSIFDVYVAIAHACENFLPDEDEVLIEGKK